MITILKSGAQRLLITLYNTQIWCEFNVLVPAVMTIGSVVLVVVSRTVADSHQRFGGTKCFLLIHLKEGTSKFLRKLGIYVPHDTQCSSAILIPCTICYYLLLCLTNAQMNHKNIYNTKVI